MKIKLIQTGKTQSAAIQQLADLYTKRIKPFISFEIITVSAAKHSAPQKALQDECAAQQKYIQAGDLIVLLDETGIAYTSVQFSEALGTWQDKGTRQIVFIIGGAYGFHPDAYSAAHIKIRLSDMTFPHELVRVVFLEQLYRAYTILNNQPYHH